MCEEKEKVQTKHKALQNHVCQIIVQLLISL